MDGNRRTNGGRGRGGDRGAARATALVGAVAAAALVIATGAMLSRADAPTPVAATVTDPQVELAEPAVAEPSADVSMPVTTPAPTPTPMAADLSESATPTVGEVADPHLVDGLPTPTPTLPVDDHVSEPELDPGPEPEPDPEPEPQVELPDTWEPELVEVVETFDHPDNEYWQEQVEAHEAQLVTDGWESLVEFVVDEGRDVLALPTFEQMALAERAPESVLVRLADGASPADIDVAGVTHRRAIDGLVPGLHAFEAVTDDFAALLDELNALAVVRYAEPDYVGDTAAVPNEPNVGANAWWLDQVNAYEAWDTATDATAIGPIMLLDSGVLETHEDLADNLWRNEAEIEGTAGVDDDGNGYVDDRYGIRITESLGTHGTPVAGTICGQGDNGIGYVGSAWDCELMEARSAFTLSGVAADFAIAIPYAIANGSRISNHSWRIYEYSQAIADTVAAAESAGHLIVAAAGNEDRSIDATPVYPASLPNTNLLTVAASTTDESRISYSSYGAVGVDLAAPTGFAVPNSAGGYLPFSGTSQSTPVVTGAVALAWAQDPSLSYLEIKQAVLDSARPVAAWSGLTVTGGILDMAALLELTAPFDTENPSTPQNLAADVEANGDVTLTWDAATDNVAVAEYQVLRNGVEIGTTADLAFTVPTPAVGSHWYQVRARDAAGNEGFKTAPVRVDIAPPDTEDPSTPQNLAALVEGNGDVTLTWDAATDDVGVAEYVVLRNGDEIGTTAEITFTVPMPAVGSHWYQVRARDAAGNEGFKTSPVRVDIAPSDTEDPSTPQNLAAVVEANGDVTLSWDAATDDVGVAEYVVFRNGDEIGTTADLAFTVPTPAVGSHWYQVRARDAAGNEGFKTSPVRVDIAPSDTEDPSTPQNLAAVVEANGDVTLSWDAATDNVAVAEYVVLRNGDEIGTTADLAFAVPTPAVGSHWFQVRARDAAGNEGFKTSPVRVDIVDNPSDTEDPSTPQNLAAVVEANGDVTLSWDAATDNVAVAEYVVLRNGDEIGTTDDLAFAVPTPAVGSHWYQVRARDAAGNEGNKTSPVRVDIV